MDRGIKPLFLRYPDLSFEEGIKNLSKNIDEVIAETEKINTALSNKPELPTTEN